MLRIGFPQLGKVFPRGCCVKCGFSRSVNTQRSDPFLIRDLCRLLFFLFYQTYYFSFLWFFLFLRSFQYTTTYLLVSSVRSQVLVLFFLLPFVGSTVFAVSSAHHRRLCVDCRVGGLVCVLASCIVLVIGNGAQITLLLSFASYANHSH